MEPRAFEYHGAVRTKTFYGDSMTLENGSVIIWQNIPPVPPIVAVIHLGPGEFVVEYSATKTPTPEPTTIVR
jgi:hypothetical protein